MRKEADATAGVDIELTSAANEIGGASEPVVPETVVPRSPDRPPKTSRWGVARSQKSPPRAPRSSKVSDLRSPARLLASARIAGRVSQNGLPANRAAILQARARIGRVVKKYRVIRVGASIPGVDRIHCAQQLTKEWLTAAFRFCGYLKPDGRVTEVTMHVRPARL